MSRIMPARGKATWLIFGGTILFLLAFKACHVNLPPPLELNNEPALLFFNNEEGCVCVRTIYERADAQIAAWPAESRHGIPLHRIHLEERPDLRLKYRIVRAPTLLLLDAVGNEVWRRDEVISDETIFDLEAVEAEILNLLRSGYADQVP